MLVKRACKLGIGFDPNIFCNPCGASETEKPGGGGGRRAVC